MRAVERIARTLRFERCDRAPVIAQLFGHAALVAGRTLDAYVSSAAVAAECQLAALAHYRHDAVFAVLDLAVEPEALGAGLTRRPGLYAAVERPPLDAGADFRRLRVPDPRADGRLPAVVELAGRLRARCGDDALVVGLVQGPMTLAVQLLGIEAALSLAVDDPERFGQLLDYGAAVATSFGAAQVAAGAHLALVFEPAASPEVVPPGFFRELVAPRLAGVFAALRRAGAIAGWLHIAGKTAPILPRYAGLGADLGCFDYCVEPAPLLPTLEGPSRLALAGNVRPLAFVVGDEAEIEAASTALLARFEQRGGFVLSSGCEIPPEAKEANVAAMVRAALARSAPPR
jgi:uroporphyrinogen decarboxylase